MRKLSVSILSVFFIVLCACAPSKLQKGQMLFDQGDFIASTTMLEQAMVEKPKDEKIKIALSGSKLKFAETLSSEADSTAEHNLPGRIELLEKAKSQIGEAHELCTDSIAIMDQVKESKKSKQKHIETYGVLQNNKQEIDSLRATINSTLSTTVNKRDQIISEVGALKKRSDKKSNAIKAYKAFKPYTVYDQYMSEVESARVYIYQKCVDRYEALGLAATEKRRYKKAKRYFDTSLKVIPSNNQGTAGLLSISAHKEIRKKKYIKAYENLIKIEDIHPRSPFFAKHMSRLKSRLLTQQLKKANRLVATKKAKNYAKSFGIYFMLLDVFKDDETITAKLNKSVGSLRQKVAGNFTSKALKLSKKNPHKYSAIILDLFANAYSFDSSVADKYADLAAKMAAYKNLKTNLSVVLYVEPTKGINETLRNRITSEVSSELESEKNQHYSVINPADLSTRKTTDLKMLKSKRVYYPGAESIVYITVIADNLSENGFNSPELKQS
ncbi:hypothetical protein KA005_33630, partial [bacterium]|nr:hypothetical protein [bacterium]